MTPKSKFAERLRELRIQKIGTVYRLSKQAGISESTLSGYEQDETEPKLGVITELCKLFEVSADYLMGLDDHMVSPSAKRFARKFESFNEHTQKITMLIVDAVDEKLTRHEEEEKRSKEQEKRKKEAIEDYGADFLSLLKHR